MKSSISTPKIVNIVLCFVLLLIFVLFIWTAYASFDKKNLGGYTSELDVLTYETESRIDSVIHENEKIINFYANIFDYNVDDILNDLRERYEVNENFEKTNIGSLKNKKGELEMYPNFEYGLIEYFYNLNKTNKSLRNEKHIPYQGDTKYIKDLIIYFSNIYQNVDPIVLLAIGAAESGHYRAQGMLNANNVFGGMLNRRLIRYNNIEVGVLTYVRMMSRNYYGQGLTTLETIGRKFCPRVENGVTQASSHWLSLVRSVKRNYQDYTYTITLNEILEVEGV